MSQLNVRISDEELSELRRFADRRRTPVSWLIRDYVQYLIGGGEPVPPEAGAPTPAELAALAQHGGAFDWLADEPDLYSLADGEPV